MPKKPKNQSKHKFLSNEMQMWMLRGQRHDCRHRCQGASFWSRLDLWWGRCRQSLRRDVQPTTPQPTTRKPDVPFFQSLIVFLHWNEIGHLSLVMVNVGLHNFRGFLLCTCDASATFPGMSGSQGSLRICKSLSEGIFLSSSLPLLFGG